MNRRILGVALLSLAFAAVCLGEESEDVGVEFVPTEVPWGEHNGSEPSGPYGHHKKPFEKGPVCVMIHECKPEIKQLVEYIRESEETKVCKDQFLECMKKVRNTEASKIKFPEECLNGVKNVFQMN